MSSGRQKSRIFLSPPHVGDEERRLVAEAFDTNWVAPVGPHLTAFEREMCEATGSRSALCVSSGTAGLHLAIRLLGVGPGDVVLCSTFTFVASANPIVYQGARPVFIDAEPGSWNMDPALLAEALADCAGNGRPPGAVVVADIYGQCADWDRIAPLAAAAGVPVVEDAAEALGATYRGRQAGTFGAIGVFSFNGNKIITTSGGGMMVSADPVLIEKACHWATQARDPAPHYEHTELGYNYRLSNVLAGIGRGQLRSLPARIERRREIFEYYRAVLGDLPGLGFMPDIPGGASNRWLTCITIDPGEAGTDRDEVLRLLAADDIEARPLWKPLHRQAVYAGAKAYGGAVSERLFAQGLCLPSGSAMTGEDLARVAGVVRSAFPAAASGPAVDLLWTRRSPAAKSDPRTSPDLVSANG
jgi:pyridoxal phosphate-dependent aminotransferase EpsN